MIQPVWNFEQEPYDEPADETAINLRAYFDRMPDDKMRQYSGDWDDDRVVEWDGEFRDDGNLMIACCERDVDVKEYRRVLEQCMRYRERVRGSVESAGSKANLAACRCAGINRHVVGNARVLQERSSEPSWP